MLVSLVTPRSNGKNSSIYLNQQHREHCGQWSQVGSFSPSIPDVWVCQYDRPWLLNRVNCIATAQISGSTSGKSVKGIWGLLTVFWRRYASYYPLQLISSRGLPKRLSAWFICR